MATTKPDDARKQQTPSDDTSAGVALNPIIMKMLSLEGQPAKAIELVGYVGPSSQDGFIRFYLKLDLSTYLEFPTAGLIYAEPPDPADSTQPIKILIDAATRLSVVESLEASFLEGSIIKSHSSNIPVPSCGLAQTTHGDRDRHPFTTPPCHHDAIDLHEPPPQAHPITTPPCHHELNVARMLKVAPIPNPKMQPVTTPPCHPN
jgi:hypothetical protein